MTTAKMVFEDRVCGEEVRVPSFIYPCGPCAVRLQDPRASCSGVDADVPARRQAAGRGGCNSITHTDTSTKPPHFHLRPRTPYTCTYFQGSWDQSLYLVNNDGSVKQLKGHFHTCLETPRSPLPSSTHHFPPFRSHVIGTARAVLRRRQVPHDRLKGELPHCPCPW